MMSDGAVSVRNPFIFHHDKEHPLPSKVANAEEFRHGSNQDDLLAHTPCSS